MTTIIEHVPMSRWGRDHWSTLAYVETRVVDHKGQLSHDHLRCIRDRHPHCYQAKRRSTAFGTDVDASRYATRLNDGTELFGHDDYDCIADMVREELLIESTDAVFQRGFDPDAVTDPSSIWVLTDKGKQVVAALRAHKGDGGNYREFRYADG